MTGNQGPSTIGTPIDDAVLLTLREVEALRVALSVLDKALQEVGDDSAAIRAAYGLGAPGSDTELPAITGKKRPRDAAPQVTDTDSVRAYVAALRQRLNDVNSFLETLGDTRT